MKFLFSKKQALILLLSFFIFDNLVSFYGVYFQGGKEANPIIAPFVERIPLLYFLLIPITYGIVYAIAEGLTALMLKIFPKQERNLAERAVFTATVIYWALSTSLLNLIYLLNIHLPLDIWGYMPPVGLVAAGSYLFWFLLRGV